jgi:hypothetical protein
MKRCHIYAEWIHDEVTKDMNSGEYLHEEFRPSPGEEVPMVFQQVLKHLIKTGFAIKREFNHG